MVNIFGYLEENVSKNYLMACRCKSGIPEMKSDFGSLTAVFDGAENHDQQDIPNNNDWLSVVEQNGNMTGVVVR